MRANQVGVTLFEIMLVLAAASAVVILGIRQYQSYQLDSTVRQIQYNVNALLQSMSFYYRVNCYGNTDPNNPLNFMPGTLNPSQNPDNPFTIDIQQDLVTPGYLAQQDYNYLKAASNAIATNISTANNAGSNGYIVQFNNYQSPRKTCQTTSSTTSVIDANDVKCTSTAESGTIYNWTIQVSVQLNSDTNADSYLALLGGDCLSSLNDDTVYPCSQNQKGNYVVWERLPSSLALPTQSPYWQIMPILQQFTQAYRTYPVTMSMPTGIPSPTGSTQYYLCGS